MKKKGGREKAKVIQKLPEKQERVETKLKYSDDKPVAAIVTDTMQIASERDIAMDVSTKIYQRFSELIKSIALFGSSAKKESKPESDIDIVVIVDDVSISWDLELISWYREELGKIISANRYIKSIHINTVKLSVWWQDLIRGDPVVINVLRYGEPLIDFGGFFAPLKILLQEGKIKPTAESVYTLLQRAPQHIQKARISQLSTIDSLYWAAVDSAHAALISAKIMPPSPEHITIILKQEFVDKKLLKMKYVDFYHDLFTLAKDISHGKINQVSGKDIDDWFARTDEFVETMAKLIDKIAD